MERRAGDIAKLVKERGWDVREAQMILGDLLYTFCDGYDEMREKDCKQSYVETKEGNNV